MSGPTPTRVRRWLGNAIWMIVAFVLYWVCVGIFGGYPRWHSATLTWIAVGVIVVFGALVWYRHERHNDEP
jgi:hypothetical protein